MSVKRHTLYNLLGSLAPAVVSVISVPAYLHLIGDARYGVLAIIWLFLGYFGLFDPGITRAALFHIARLNLDSNKKERESVFVTALLVNLAFGIAGGLVLYLVARPLFMVTFKMPETMRAEVMASLAWFAASVPISIVTAVLGGALQARECFGLFNAISAGNALASQLVPLAVAYFHGPDLKWLIPAILITRMAGAIPSVLALAKFLPFGVGGKFKPSMVKTLFTYGGWITVTNLISPLLNSMDRMLIGSVLNAESVAFYTVSFNLVSRVSVIPGALSTSVFPKLSRGSKEDSAKLAEHAVIGLSAVMTPLIICAVAATPLLMRVWVGRDFARHAAPVAIILLVGMWFNGLAFIPSEHLQAVERPDLPAKFHLIELAPFLGILWAGLHFFGLQGAAWAWTLRVTADAILLFVIADKTPGWKQVLPGGLLVLVATVFSPTTLLSMNTAVEVIVLAAAIVWSWTSSPILRSLVRRRSTVELAQAAL